MTFEESQFMPEETAASVADGAEVTEEVNIEQLTSEALNQLASLGVPPGKAAEVIGYAGGNPSQLSLLARATDTDSVASAFGMNLEDLLDNLNMECLIEGACEIEGAFSNIDSQSTDGVVVAQAGARSEAKLTETSEPGLKQG